jgi:GTP-dependent phosphoenolpyruvate carboxykinase
LDGFNEEKFQAVQNVDMTEWYHEALSQEEFFMKLWSHLPKELMLHRELLVSRL